MLYASRSRLDHAKKKTATFCWIYIDEEACFVKGRRPDEQEAFLLLFSGTLLEAIWTHVYLHPHIPSALTIHFSPCILPIVRKLPQTCRAFILYHVMPSWGKSTDNVINQMKAVVLVNKNTTYSFLLFWREGRNRYFPLIMITNDLLHISHHTRRAGTRRIGCLLSIFSCFQTYPNSVNQAFKGYIAKVGQELIDFGDNYTNLKQLYHRFIKLFHNELKESSSIKDSLQCNTEFRNGSWFYKLGKSF